MSESFLAVVDTRADDAKAVAGSSITLTISGCPHSLYSARSDTVFSVKLKMSALLGAPPSQLWLHHRGRRLQDERRLRDCKLPSPCIIDVQRFAIPFVKCPTPGCAATILPEKVKSHVRRCPVLYAEREKLALGIFSRSVNWGLAAPAHIAAASDNNSDLTATSAAPPSPLPEEEFATLLLRAHTEAVGADLIHTPLGAACEPRKSATRHAAQRSAIAALLGRLGVLGHGHTVVEFGAGNGELSLTIAQAQTAPEAGQADFSIALVDAATPPESNADGRLRQILDLRRVQGRGGDTCGCSTRTGTLGVVGTADGSCFWRFKIGLEDLLLQPLCERVAPGRRCVVAAKHLCGAATDFALRAVVAARGMGAAPIAVVLGTCCHHRCAWAAYPNHAFLAQHGVGRADFERMARLTGAGVDRRVAHDSVDLARRAKDLIDQGRVEYLRANGFDASLETYVDAAVSPENVLIVATASTACSASRRKQARPREENAVLDPNMCASCDQPADEGLCRG